jgi:aspartokinase
MLRTAAIVRGRRERGLKPVVVVSAMAKVTDLLLAAAAAAGRGDKATTMAIAQRLRIRHFDTAAELVSGDAFPALRTAICDEFDALDDLLRGINAVGELTPRTGDNVVSFGERISSWMVAAAFAHLGMEGVHVDSRTCIITNDHYGKAVPQDAGHGRLYRLHARGDHHHAGTRRQRLYRGAGGRRVARRRHRDMDGRERHHDHRPAHLPGCTPGEDDQL